MKKRIAFAMAALMLMSAAPVYADDTVNVSVNGTPVTFADSGAVIIDSRTMIPLRGVFEQLGYTVSWDGATKTATLAGKDIIRITAGSNVFYAGDDREYSEVPAQIINGRLYLPLRAVGEAADMDVRWDSVTKTAYIGDFDDMMEQAAQEQVTVDTSDIQKLVSDTFSVSLLAGIADEYEDYIEDRRGTRAEYIQMAKAVASDTSLITATEYADNLIAILDNTALSDYQLENELERYSESLDAPEDAYKAEMNKIIAAADASFVAQLNSTVQTTFTTGDDLYNIEPGNMSSFIQAFNSALDKAVTALDDITASTEADAQALELYKSLVSTLKSFMSRSAELGIDMGFDIMD